MRASLINTVIMPYKLYGELTEFSSCGLRKSGRILLATGGRQAGSFKGRHRKALPDMFSLSGD